MPHAFDRIAFDSVAFDVEPAQTGAGPSGISRKRRRGVNPPSSLQVPKRGFIFGEPEVIHISARVRPKGFAAQLVLSNPRLRAGAVVFPYGFTAMLSLNQVTTRGSIDISDEELILLLSAA